MEEEGRGGGGGWGGSEDRRCTEFFHFDIYIHIRQWDSVPAELNKHPVLKGLYLYLMYHFIL